MFSVFLSLVTSGLQDILSSDKAAVRLHACSSHWILFGDQSAPALFLWNTQNLLHENIFIFSGADLNLRAVVLSATVWNKDATPTPQISLYSSTTKLCAVWSRLSVGDTKCSATHRVCRSKSGSRRDRASVYTFKEEINVLVLTSAFHTCRGEDGAGGEQEWKEDRGRRRRRCRWRPEVLRVHLVCGPGSAGRLELCGRGLLRHRGLRRRDRWVGGRAW